MRAQDGTCITYKGSPNAPVHKLVSAYTKDRALYPTDVVLVHEGRKLAEQKTLQSHGLEDGDVIDCVIHQVGD